MSHSSIDIVNVADTFPYTTQAPNEYFHFRTVSYPNITLGYMLPSVALALVGSSTLDWLLQQDNCPKTITLVSGHDETTRTAILDTITRWMQSTRKFKALEKWRDELFPVYGPNKELLFSIERSASPLFGVVTYGVNMTAFEWTSSHDGEPAMRIWVPRRSGTRAKFPGMLDTTVGGGLTTGEIPRECLVRESKEEASLEEDTVKQARDVGTVTYFYLSGEGSGCEFGLAQPECTYIFDLDLTGLPSVIPAPNDGSVEKFSLLTVAEVKWALSHKEFKPNCALFMLDFLIRHEQLKADSEPDFEEICSRMHRVLDFPRR